MNISVQGKSPWQDDFSAHLKEMKEPCGYVEKAFHMMEQVEWKEKSPGRFGEQHGGFYSWSKAGMRKSNGLGVREVTA